MHRNTSAMQTKYQRGSRICCDTLRVTILTCSHDWFAQEEPFDGYSYEGSDRADEKRDVRRRSHRTADGYVVERTVTGDHITHTNHRHTVLSTCMSATKVSSMTHMHMHMRMHMHMHTSVFSALSCQHCTMYWHVTQESRSLLREQRRILNTVNSAARMPQKVTLRYRMQHASEHGGEFMDAQQTLNMLTLGTLEI